MNTAQREKSNWEKLDKVFKEYIKLCVNFEHKITLITANHLLLSLSIPTIQRKAENKPFKFNRRPKKLSWISLQKRNLVGNVVNAFKPIMSNF